MAYHTREKLLKSISELKVIQLTDDNNTGMIDEEVLAEIEKRATTFINSFLKSLYVLPLTTVPDEIADVSVDLTTYWMYDRRFELELPQGMKDKFKNAESQLKRIQSGELTLNIAKLSDGVAVAISRTNKRTRLFGKDTLDCL